MAEDAAAPPAVPEPLAQEAAAALAAAAEALGLIVRLHDREADAVLIEGLVAADAGGLLAAILAGEDGRTGATAFADALAGLAGADQAALDLVAADWADVHVTHGHRASPNGSVWLTVDSLERQQPMFDVRGWYEHYGLAVPNWRARSDDNIVHELQFVQHLLTRGTRPAAEDAGRFLDGQVLPWVPEWGRRVAARAATPFVAASGLVTALFVEALRELIVAVTGRPRAEVETRRAEAEADPRPFMPGVQASW